MLRIKKNYNDEHDIDPNEWNAARIAKQLHESEEVDASKEEDEAGIGTGFISGLAAAGIGAGILKRQQIKDGLINKTNTARAYMADKIHPEKQTK